MKLKSLGRKTDLIFSRFSGTVTDRGNYILIKTPSNPDFYWGNFIIFDSPPKKESFKDWTQIFDREFEYYKKPHHYTFTWDVGSGETPECSDFFESNFDLDSGVVLSTDKVIPPPRQNTDILIRTLTSHEDWQQALELQIACADPKFLNEHFRGFKTAIMKQYKSMSENKLGHWYGAFLKDKLVGNLGLYFDGAIGRYQSVGTHPDFRKQAICGNLVYEAGKKAFATGKIKTLVMEADPEYHAARIYESVGFKKTETNQALSWWAGKAMTKK